jgi:hypothetical protein
MGERTRARIECLFATDVGPDDDRSPAEVVISHGRASGHELSVTTVED